MKVTKKTAERIASALPKFQKVLAIAKDRDLNESDTVSIITDVLSEVFGYDKYLEVTSELAIRGTYCDIAVKLDGKYQFLVECKAIGTELKEQHLRQAVGYGANKGVQWIILTNGADWQVYRLRFEQPIAYDLVARFDMLSVSPRDERAVELLAVLSKEGVEKEGREELYEKVQCVNRFVVGALLQTEPLVCALRKELRRISDGVSIGNEELLELLRGSVLRRDLLEGEEADAAARRISKANKAAARKCPEPPKPSAPSESLSDQLLATVEEPSAATGP